MARAITMKSAVHDTPGRRVVLALDGGSHINAPAERPAASAENSHYAYPPVRSSGSLDVGDKTLLRLAPESLDNLLRPRQH